MTTSIRSSLASPLTQNSPSYPGVSAAFEVTRKWDEFYKDFVPLFRSLQFKTKTSKALFTQVGVYGYRNGSVVLRLFFDTKNKSTVENYFKEIGITPDAIDLMQGILPISKLDEKAKLVKILLDNNKFPKDETVLMQSLLVAESWYDVTPPHFSQLHLLDPNLRMTVIPIRDLAMEDRENFK